MGQIEFSVSARAARLIGQENFANADGAVVELVKNCYDADASNSIVFFDNENEDISKHSIFIIDNGIGMTDTIIKNYWMMIGTDNKEMDVRSDTGRVKTGAKGIGRFALDRLGTVTEMYTFPKAIDQGYYWKVNWEDFKKPGFNISDVKATLDSLIGQKYAAIITETSTSSERLLNYIENIDFSNGTLIKISGLRDRWEEDDISRLFNNLEILIPPKEQPDFKLALFSIINSESYGELAGAYYDDYDYKLAASYQDDENKDVIFTLQRNELDKARVENEFSKVFDMPLMRRPPFDLESFKRDSITYTMKLSELIKGYSETEHGELLNKIGRFSFTFYYLKNTRSDNKNEADIDKYPYRNFNSSNRKAWLKKFGGVKIFRDEFRVRPYGENGQDWLGLGDRQSASPQGAGQRIGSYRIGPNQISGTINISRLTNLSFQDKSGREGIQENIVFDLFRKIILNIINQFEKDRNVIMYSFSELYKIVKAEEAAKAAAEELARQVLEQQRQIEESNAGKTAPANSEPQTEAQIKPEPAKTIGPSETELLLAKGYQAKEEEVHQKDEEIRLLRGLSGTGLIVASVAHELRSIRSLLVIRTEDLKRILEKLIDKKALKSLQDYENPYSMLNHMRDQDVQIKHWLDYSLSALRRDRRTRRILHLPTYFETYSANWESVCKRRRVTLSIKINHKDDLNLKAFMIDFDTIFNNLLANSFDSFKRQKENIPRKVDIEIDKIDDLLVVVFSDNGAGLSRDYLKNPEEIFLPFESSKVDRRGEKIGTGMGMYLVKSIIEEYKGSIEILRVTKGFALQITFPLRKNS